MASLYPSQLIQLPSWLWEWNYLPSEELESRAPSLLVADCLLD